MTREQIERLAAKAELPLALGRQAQARRPAPPRLSPLQLVADPAKREQVRQAAARLPQPSPASQECAFAAAFLALCARPLLYNPFPAVQAALLQMAGYLLVDAGREPQPGWLYVTAEAGEITGMGVVKVPGEAEWFVALDGRREGPYRRDRRSVAYWLAPGGG